MRHSCRGIASAYSFKVIALWLVSLAAIGCGNTVTLPDGDVIDLDGVNLNDIDLDGVDVDQDILSKLDIKSDTISGDVDASGTDAIAPDTDTATGTDAADTADIASGCTSTAACNDGNPCTDDTCSTDGVCLNASNTATCDDGNTCTQGDACKAGACLPGAATDCSDNNPCTDDSCDKASGCINLANTATCEDGSACTKNDACAAGSCLPGAIVDCEDGNGCTTDSCDIATGCTSVNNEDPCNDFDPCTVDDACSAGLCVSVAKNCGDNNACTNDSCDAATGDCLHTDNNDATCEDGNPCTTAQYCYNAQCLSDGSLNCNDDNQCTKDSCDPVTGCKHENLSDSACSDGNPCTNGDFCADGACLAGDPTTCNDDNKCTTDSCDSAVGGCVNLANAATCDDGDPCTLADTCTQTVCEGTPNTCDQGPYNATTCSTMTCDYTDGVCKQNNSTVWSGTFKTAAGWKLQGEWQIGMAMASTGETFGWADPASDDDADGDGYVAGTVIGGDISNTPHDWYFLTSPVIDLSAHATSTYLYSDPAATSWNQYNQSLVLAFQWRASLSATGGQYLTVQWTGDGKNWATFQDPISTYNDSYWRDPSAMSPTGEYMLIPKPMLTKHFQFRIGYKITAVEAIVPLVSGLSIDAPQIGIGNCWD